IPPYTTNSLGFSATSGSRLFINMRNGASVSQLLAVSLLPRAARISTSRYFVGLLSVTKKTPQRSIQTSPGSGRGSLCGRPVTSGSRFCAPIFLTTHAHTHTFTCTYKHMQSSGQLDGSSFNNALDLVKTHLKQGFSGRRFFRRFFAAVSRLLLEHEIAPRWGAR